MSNTVKLAQYLAFLYLSCWVSLGISHAQPGSNDVTFNVGTGPNAIVLDMLVQPDSNIVVAGGFNFWDNKPLNALGRFSGNGTVDLTFNYQSIISSPERVVFVRPFGTNSYIISGVGTENNLSVHFLAMINDDGSRDTSFPIQILDQPIETLHVLEDSTIIMSGGFASVNGVTTNNMIALDSDGNIVRQNTLPIDGNITFKVLSDNKLIAVTSIFGIDGFENRLYKMNEDWTLDNSFNNGILIKGLVYTVEVLPDGVILIGGDFNEVDGVSKTNIAAFQGNGDLITAFDISMETGSRIFHILYLNEQNILVSGQFNSIENQPFSGIAQISRDGDLMTKFKSPDDIGHVRKVALHSDDKVYIIGDFNQVNGVTQRNIARLYSTSVSTSDDDDTYVLPIDFSIQPNYPNPFNPTTNIRFDLPAAAGVSVTVYDIMGRVVMQLPTSSMNAGRHTISLDASRLGSGVYLYRVIAGKYQGSGKMTVFK